MEQPQQQRKPNARKMLPSRTLRVINVPENGSNLFDLLSSKKFEANYVGGNYYIRLDEPADVLKEVYRTLRSNDFRVFYQNYFIYFKITNADSITYEGIRTLRENLRAVLAPAQVLDFVLYKRAGASGGQLWKGDGHIVLDSREDLLKVLESKKAEVEGHAFSFYAYKFKKGAEVPVAPPLEIPE